MDRSAKKKSNRIMIEDSPSQSSRRPDSPAPHNDPQILENHDLAELQRHFTPKNHQMEFADPFSKAYSENSDA
jgi:hypothetical protein